MAKTKKRDARLISLGYGRFVRADRVFALIPLAPDERGGGPADLRARRRDRGAAGRLPF